MATYSPIITTLPRPAIEVTSVSDLNYNTLNASIGTFNYRFENLYQYSNTLDQLLEPIYLKKFSKQGDRNVMYLNMTIDPYQFVSSLTQDVAALDYNFDSNNAFIPTILANTALNYVFDIHELSANDLFTRGETNFGQLEFFDDYTIDF
jgi:hypothetical protein